MNTWTHIVGTVTLIGLASQVIAPELRSKNYVGAASDFLLAAFTLAAIWH